MDESQDGSAFSFGSVQDTFYENVNQQILIGKLPYNPFLFDLTLLLKQSSTGYEAAGLQFPVQSTMNNIFGRKTKKKNEEDQLRNSIEIKHELLAQTMSKNHFSISTSHQLNDLGSKKGTYIWIHRTHPKLLQVGDQFLLNQHPIKVNSINKSNQKIELQVSESKTLTLNPKLFKQRLFLIGSGVKCHFVVKDLEPYHVGVDLLAMTLHNFIEDEDCSCGKGTWMRIKEAIKVEGGDVIMAYPYVFEIRY